jgi:hypothetical protein
MSGWTAAWLILASSCALAQQAAGEWKPLFDGRTLNGWKEAPIPGHGPVRVKNGAIHLGRGSMTGIAWTGEFPKSGYEIRFEAVRLEGNDFFAGITFPVNGTFCTWINGGWGGDVVGLSNVDGYDASENETSMARDFAAGRWYSFRLVVTPGRIRAWIDGAIVVDLEIAGRKIDLRFDDTDLCKPLGFASYATEAALRNIQYRMLMPEGRQ